MNQTTGLIKDAYDRVIAATDLLAMSIRQQADRIQCQVQFIPAPLANDVDDRLAIDVIDLPPTIDSLITAVTDYHIESKQHRKYSKRYPGLARVPSAVLSAAEVLNMAKIEFVHLLDELLPTKSTKTNSTARRLRQNALRYALPTGTDRRTLERRIHLIESEVHRLQIRWGKNPRSSVKLSFEEVIELIDNAPMPDNEQLEAFTIRMDKLRAYCHQSHKEGWQFIRYFISRSAAPRISYERLDESIHPYVAQNLATPALILDSVMPEDQFADLCAHVRLKPLNLLSKDEILAFEPSGPTSIKRENLFFQGLHVLHKKAESRR